MSNDATKRSLVERCLHAYESRTPLARGKLLELEQLTDDEITGLYVSVMERFLMGIKVSLPERVALLELISPNGSQEFARISCEALLEQRRRTVQR